MAIIQFSEIQLVKDVSIHLQARATPYIEQAEFLDLKPLLGEKFYADVVANVNEDPYGILVNGGNYTYDGTEIYCPGIRKVLIEYSYARIVFFANETSTPFGLVDKNYQDGKHSDRIRLKEIYKASQQIAYQYWLEVEKYLIRNHNSFPNFGCGNGRTLSNFKLRHIT